MFVPPTVAQFKAQFFRDFPYSVQGSGSALSVAVVAGGVSLIIVTAPGGGYPDGSAVQISGNGTGAKATANIQDGQVISVNVTDPGTGYTAATATVQGRGDPTDLSKVQDQDISNALLMAGQNFNAGLFGTQADYQVCYNLLAAHYLVTNLTASSMGLNGTAEWLTQSKSVGNVSETYQIPERIMRSPWLALISKTRYGAQYLSLIAPKLIANVLGMRGRVSAE